MNSILNFGSLNIDHVYTVDHFVRPGETLATQDYRIFPGGKGLNQSLALARAGARVCHAGKIGPDGAHLIALLKENGVDTCFVDSTGSCTGQAIIQVNAQGQNCILLNKGANHEISSRFSEEVLASFGEGDVLVLQNEINDIPQIMRAAYDRGMRIALNPSPVGPELSDYPLDLVTWLLLNEVEGHALTGETSPDRIGDTLLARYPIMRIVLTLGDQGVCYRDSDHALSRGIYRVPVVDTTAAGDTFTGFFISQVFSGQPVEEALRVATAASSIAVSREGAAVSIPTLEEVLSSGLLEASET